MIAVTACTERAPSSVMSQLLTWGADFSVFVDARARLGSRANTWRAIKEAGRLNDSLILLQDDIELTGDALEAMHAYAWRCPLDVGVVNFHDFGGGDFLPWDAPEPGAHKFEAHPFGGRGMSGAQALVIPRENVLWLASCDPNARELLNDIQGPHGADYAIGWWTQRGPRPWKLVIRPSPIRHVGFSSLCWPARPHTPQAPMEEGMP